MLHRNVRRLWGRILIITLVGMGGLRAHEETVQERLGYPKEAKLLVIHGDDLGLGHGKNVATFKAMEEGIVTSASVMMTTPWVGEVVDYAAVHPEVDLGVHITLTAEWKHYKLSLIHI